MKRRPRISSEPVLRFTSSAASRRRIPTRVSISRWSAPLIGVWSPAISPELMLCSDWLQQAINLYEMSSWTRGIVIPRRLHMRISLPESSARRNGRKRPQFWYQLSSLA